MEKIRNKAEGYILVEAVLGIITFTLLSMAFMTIFSGSFNQLAATRTAAQAQQYAELDAELLRLVNYEYLNDDAVLAEYSLHKSRGTIQSVADAGSWQDEIIIGNETYTADGETNKYRIATINIYRNSSDTLPRASLEVPLSSQASGMPIGTVITWPSEGNPTYGGEWLECNGQEVPSKYTALRKIMSRVPDYRGMFLRGHGSKSFSQDLGMLNPNASTTYSSGSVGEIQGDAMRLFYGYTPTLFFIPATGESFTAYHTSTQERYLPSSVDKKAAILSFGRPRNNDAFLEGMGFWLHGKNPFHYRYTVTSETTGEGENAQTTYSLEETKEPVVTDGEDGKFAPTGCWYGMELSNAYSMPIANELRPVNVAVRFFIKAR